MQLGLTDDFKLPLGVYYNMNGVCLNPAIVCDLYLTPASAPSKSQNDRNHTDIGFTLIQIPILSQKTVRLHQQKQSFSSLYPDRELLLDTDSRQGKEGANNNNDGNGK